MAVLASYVRQVVENNIKKSFLANDPNKLSLRKWLMIAMGDNNQESYTLDMLVQFRFADGQSLVDYAINESNLALAQYHQALPWYKRLFINKEKNKLKAQSNLKSIIDIWQQQKDKSITVHKNTQLSFFESFIRRIKAWVGYTYEPPALNTNINPFADETFFTKLKTTLPEVTRTQQLNQSQAKVKPGITYVEQNASFKERLQPAEILKPEIIANRMQHHSHLLTRKHNTAAATNTDQQQNIIPTHLVHWVQEITLQQEVDQVIAAQQMQQQNALQAQHDAFELKNNFDLAEKPEINMWTDNSAWHVMENLNDQNYTRYGIYSWLYVLREQIENAQENKAYSTEFYISDNAWKILLAGKGLVKASHYIDLAALPLGFFLDKESGGFTQYKFVLKYDENYREYQKTNLPDVNLRMDPAANINGRIEYTSVTTKILQYNHTSDARPKLISLLDQMERKCREMDIDLTFSNFSKLKKALNKLCSKDEKFVSPVFEYYQLFAVNCYRPQPYQTLQLMLANALLDIIEALDANIDKNLNFKYRFERFVKFVSYLEQFYKRKLYNTPLLHELTYCFLYQLNDPNAFHTDEALFYLDKVLALSDEEVSLFFALSNVSYDGFSEKAEITSVCHTPNFGENCRGFLYFLNYLKEHKYSLPKDEGFKQLLAYIIRNEHYKTHNVFSDSHTFEGSGFVRFKGIIDCIALVQQNQSQQLAEWQATYLAHMPYNYPAAKQLLQSGYTFIHEAMLLDDYFYRLENDTITRYPFDIKFSAAQKVIYMPKVFKITFNDPHYITLSEFENLTYDASYSIVDYRAIYLRFVALYVAPEHLQAAIDTWENKTSLAINAKDQENLTSATINTAIWGELVTYAMQLPHKSKAEINNEYSVKSSLLETQYEAIDSPAKKRIAARQYVMTDIDTLFAKLNIKFKVELAPQEEQAKRDALLAALKQNLSLLNHMAPHYAIMPQMQLVNELKTKVKILKEKATPDQQMLMACLAMLREVHYRFTYRKDDNVPPEEDSKLRGEWLRLEQVVAVLLGLEKDCLLEVDTSEGKTLIVQVLAILKVLQNHKIDVITHNEYLADTSANAIMRLANYLELKIAKKTHATSEIADADIYFTDISAAVINDLVAQEANEHGNEKRNTSNDIRVADTAIIDEVDNIAIDIQAFTTMQLAKSDGKASAVFEDFLFALNNIVRDELAKFSDSDKDKQLAFVKDKLAIMFPDPESYFQKIICQNNTEEQVTYWLKAAVSAMSLVEKEDYIIAPNNSKNTSANEKILIVHKNTTGRVDKISTWSNGVHQCVAAWERQKNKRNIYIPAIAEVVRQGNAVKYLQTKYQSRVCTTGSAGEKPVQMQIVKSLQLDVMVDMPRAKREADEDINWPKKVLDDLNTVGDIYNRSYRFAPIYVENQEQLAAKLLETLRIVQASDQSSIVFFNTIAECEAFYEYLRNDSQINTAKMQIFDDTSDVSNTSKALRPNETTVITNAKLPGMITLVTTAGSRGNNFNDINVGIIAKPSLGRVAYQKASRVGRNAQFALVYEIYAKDDLVNAAQLPDLTPQPAQTVGKVQTINHDFRLFVTIHESINENAILNTLKQKDEGKKPS